MFLISDKLEKMPSQYETLRDEKSDLMKEDVVEFSSSVDVPRICLKSAIYAFLTAVFIFLAAWITFTVQYKENSLGFPYGQYVLKSSVSDIDNELHTMALGAVYNATQIISKIRDQTATMSEQNKLSTKEYISNIREVIKERTTYGVRRISQLIQDRVQDIENELTVFDKDIATMVDGNLDVTMKDIQKITEEVKKTESGDAAEMLKDSLKKLENEISEMTRDFDQMFTFYSHYIKDTLYQKVQNATDKIRMFLVSERKFSKCIDWERIDFCYNITRQNTEISIQMESVINVINVLSKTTETVNTVTSLYPEEQLQLHPLIRESKTILNNALNDTQTVLNSMLKNDDNFLGTVVREYAYKDHHHTKNYVLRNYQTAIESLIPGAREAVKGFKIVQDKFLERTKEVLDPAIETLSNEIYHKALLINDTKVGDDIIERSKFKETKLKIEEKFHNVTSVVNPIFEENLNFWVEGIELTLVYDRNENLPFVSILSIENYLAADICPLSVDYQKYISSLLDEYLSHTTDLNVVHDMVGKPLELDGEFFAKSHDEMQTVYSNDVKDVYIPVKGDLLATASEDGKVPTVELRANKQPSASLQELIQSVLKDVTDAGYNVEGPVEVYIDEDKKKK